MRASQRALLTNWGLLGLASLLLALVVATSGFVTSGEREARARHVMTAFRLDDIRELVLRSNDQRVVLRRGERAADLASPGSDERAVGEREAATPDARWLLIEPLQATAEEGRVDQLLRDLRFATWVRQIPAEAVDAAAFGLHEPKSVLEVKMGAIRYELRLGGPAPAPSGAHYLQVAGDGVPNPGVYVVSESTVAALNVGLQDLRVRQLVPFGRSSIARLELMQGKRAVYLERQPGQAPAARDDWFRFARDFGRARVSSEVMDRVFWSLARSEAQHFVDLPQAKQAQSQEALLKVRLDTNDGERLELHFGGACPADDALLLATRHGVAETAACVRQLAFDDLLKQSELLIDRQLFTFSVDEVERLSIVQGARRMDLLRRDDAFVLREPVEGPVDRALGTQRLEAILGARGEWLAEPPLPVDAAELSHTVTITAGGASEEAVRDQRVSISEPLPDGSHFVYRHQDSAWLRVGKPAVRAMRPDALLIRSRQLLDVDDERVERVEVRAREWTQVLEQPQRGEFQLRSPAGYPVDAGLAVELVDVLARLSLERWISPDHEPGQFGLASPQLEVLVDTDAGRALHLRIGDAAVQGGHYATRDGEPAVFTLETATIERLRTLLISRAMLMVDAAALQGLRLTTPERRVELSRLGLELVQVGGDEQLPQERIERVVDALSLIRPEAAISLNTEDGEYGFERPVLEVVARTDSELLGGSERDDASLESSARWIVGARGLYRDMSVYYVRLHGRSAVFAVPRQQVETLLNALR